MLISFSVEKMRPYIEAGIRQAKGEDVGGARVKRQTIRRMGPRWREIVEVVQRHDFYFPADLHLWWKSRTPQRERLGVIGQTIATNIRIYPITIKYRMETFSGEPDAVPTLWVKGPEGWRDGLRHIFTTDFDSTLDGPVKRVARADGFDSVSEFKDYFVPNLGDVFEGVLIKW